MKLQQIAQQFAQGYWNAIQKGNKVSKAALIGIPALLIIGSLGNTHNASQPKPQPSPVAIQQTQPKKPTQAENEQLKFENELAKHRRIITENSNLIIGNLFVYGGEEGLKQYQQMSQDDKGLFIIGVINRGCLGENELAVKLVEGMNCKAALETSKWVARNSARVSKALDK